MRISTLLLLKYIFRKRPDTLSYLAFKPLSCKSVKALFTIVLMFLLTSCTPKFSDIREFKFSGFKEEGEGLVVIKCGYDYHDSVPKGARPEVNVWIDIKDTRDPDNVFNYIHAPCDGNIKVTTVKNGIYEVSLAVIGDKIGIMSGVYGSGKYIIKNNQINNLGKARYTLMYNKDRNGKSVFEHTNNFSYSGYALKTTLVDPGENLLQELLKTHPELKDYPINNLIHVAE